jgi:hypothetical protein
MDKISKNLEKLMKKFDVITLNLIELIKKLKKKLKYMVKYKKAYILISHFSKHIAKIRYLV